MSLIMLVVQLFFIVLLIRLFYLRFLRKNKNESFENKVNKISLLKTGGLLIGLSGVAMVILGMMWGSATTQSDWEITHKFGRVPVILLILGGFFDCI